MKKAIVFILMLGFLACGEKKAEKKEVQVSVDKLQTTATNYPLYYFLSRIAGEAVETSYLIPEGPDPAFWQPDRESVQQLQAMDLIFTNGATYEKWLAGISLAQNSLVNTSVSFESDYITTGDGKVHSHGDGEEHSHEGTAFTTWLDFELASRQASAIYERLAKAAGPDSTAMKQKLGALHSELSGLDKRMTKLGKALEGQTVIVSHPVYQYWARKYNIHVMELHWEPEEDPGEAGWNELGNLKALTGAKIFLWEGTPSEANAQGVEDLGLSQIVFSPMGNSPGIDFIQGMNTQIESLESMVLE